MSLHTGPLDFDPINLLRDFETVHPAREDLMQRWTQNFTHAHEPKSNPPRALRVEVVLTPGQAASGGILPFEVPRATVCRRCHGSGVTGFCTCDLCGGRRLDWEMARVDAILPASAVDGTAIEISLRRAGVVNFYLQVHARVASASCRALPVPICFRISRHIPPVAL